MVIHKCPVYKCKGEIKVFFTVGSYYKACPECGISEADIEAAGTNDREVIYANTGKQSK